MLQCYFTLGPLAAPRYVRQWLHCLGKKFWNYKYPEFEAKLHIRGYLLTGIHLPLKDYIFDEAKCPFDIVVSLIATEQVSSSIC